MSQKKPMSRSERIEREYDRKFEDELESKNLDTPFVAPDFTYLVQFAYHYCDEEIIILCQDSLQSNLVGFMQRIGFGHYANSKGPISGKLYHAFCRTEERLKRWEASFYMDDVSQRSTLC